MRYAQLHSRHRIAAALRRRAIRMAGTCALVALGVTALGGSSVFACEGPLLTLRRVVNLTDRIVIGVIVEPRTEADFHANHRYVVNVEQVIKESDHPDVIQLGPYPVNDCPGTVPVFRGDRAVLELYPGGGVGIWKVYRDGTVVSSGRADPPGTLDALLAEYADLGVPDTATGPVASPVLADLSLPTAAGVPRWFVPWSASWCRAFLGVAATLPAAPPGGCPRPVSRQPPVAVPRGRAPRDGP